MKPLLIVIGPGRLGTSLALDVAQSGMASVRVVGRSANAPALLRSEDVDYRAGSVRDALHGLGASGAGDADVAIVLAVPDDQLEVVARTSLSVASPRPRR